MGEWMAGFDNKRNKVAKDDNVMLLLLGLVCGIADLGNSIILVISTLPI